jgi:hypothetical protein
VWSSNCRTAIVDREGDVRDPVAKPGDFLAGRVLPRQAAGEQNRIFPCLKRKTLLGDFPSSNPRTEQSPSQSNAHK